MNNMQRKTLEKVFARPVVKNLDWAELEGLLVALGAERLNRGGSMVSFFLGNERADFHRPHPAKEAKPYQVRCAREFLDLAGVKP
jgi:HicA toxin of bacterial toxin-antitoxin,